MPTDPLLHKPHTSQNSEAMAQMQAIASSRPKPMPPYLARLHSSAVAHATDWVGNVHIMLYISELLM